jgi:hypothetical protein
VSYHLSTDSALEAAITLSPGGVLGGIPSTAGVFDFSVIATDAVGTTGTRLCTLRAYSSVEVPEGIVGWWRAEGDAQDSAGSNHGAVHGATAFAEDKVGQAFSLDGATGYVGVPDAADLRPAALRSRRGCCSRRRRAPGSSSPNRPAGVPVIPTPCG